MLLLLLVGSNMMPCMTVPMWMVLLVLESCVLLVIPLCVTMPC